MISVMGNRVYDTVMDKLVDALISLLSVDLLPKTSPVENR